MCNKEKDPLKPMWLWQKLTESISLLEDKSDSDEGRKFETGEKKEMKDAMINY